jgi:DNA-directed RNA polymerase alpha subunit
MDCGDAAEMVGDKVKVIDIQKFESCKRCRELITRDAIMGNLVPDEFLFTVESNGALTPKRIVTEAVKILKKRLGELNDKIDADDLHSPISDFDFTRPEERKLYSDGSEDSDEEEVGTTGDTE